MTPKPDASPQAAHPAVDKVLLLMVSGMGPSDLLTACIAKLDVDPADAPGVIAAARRKLTLAADYNRDEQLGTAVTRLHDLYARAIRAQDIKTALATQREINRLLGLGEPACPVPAAGGAGAEGEAETGGGAGIAWPHDLWRSLTAPSSSPTPPPPQ